MSLTDTQNFLAALVGPMQTLELAIQQCVTERGINNAVGEQLTTLGVIVGRPREGVTDDEIYRRLVRAQISVNKSNGTTNELINIAVLVVFDPAATIVIDNTGIASLTLRVDGVIVDYTVASSLIAFLRKAISAGIRLILEWALSPPATMFRFLPFAGPSSGRGYATFSDPTDGGHLGSAAE